MTDDLAEIFFLSCLQEAFVSSSGVCRDVHSVVHPAFPLPTTASPATCPEGWFWEDCRLVGHAQIMQVPVS